jgi:hypothetical protein
MTKNLLAMLTGQCSDDRPITMGLIYSLLSEGMSRIGVLQQLRRSAEGQAHGAYIRGVDTAKTVEELLAHED